MHRSLVPLSLAFVLVLTPAAYAQTTATQPRIVVSGEGEAFAAPDMAILTLSVLREAATARAALSANNEAMAAVIAAMKETGVEARDLQTAGLQINPRYVYPKPEDRDQQPRIDGYQVVNTLTVRVRDISAVGDALDRSVSLGVNQGGGIRFTNDNPSATLSEARKRAVANALDKARTLAEAASVEVGTIVEISEQNFVQPPMPYMARAMARDAAESVPVEAGETSYRVQVNVTFELK